MAAVLGVGAQAQPRQQGQQSGQQQEQAQDPQQGQRQAQPQEQPQAAPAKPVYASQDADKPPYSQDRLSQNSPQSAPNTPSQAAPGTLTIPSGTILLVRINDFLSSDHNQIGDTFTAVLEQPVVVNGWVVARRGQVLIGHVQTVHKAGRIKGVSQLGVELTDLTVVDGKQVPILTELWRGSGGTSRGQDAATVGTATGLGALIGAAADWGRGAAIGAGAGAAAGIGAVLLTRGRPTVLEPETQLSFRLSDPVPIDTTQSQQAFVPVKQEDFEGGRSDHRRPRLASGYSGPALYPCGYYGGCYPYGPFVGFYDGYGWGRGFYGGGFYGRRGFHY